MIASSVHDADTKTMKEHINQINYVDAQLSPDKKFIALLGKGWESVHIKIYSISAKKLYDVKDTELYPIDFSWDHDGYLTGQACQYNGSFCGDTHTYISANTLNPWIIESVK